MHHPMSLLNFLISLNLIQNPPKNNELKAEKYVIPRSSILEKKNLQLFISLSLTNSLPYF